MIRRPILILVGGVSTVLAIAGAMLPGLPTTPFLLVALWAFARSSETLHRKLHQIPVLKTALAEAKRFEERGTVRLSVKLTAMAFAWGSVLLTALTAGTTRPMLVAAVGLAALGGTLFMCWVPTDRS
jgi:uncharacterized protein